MGELSRRDAIKGAAVAAGLTATGASTASAADDKKGPGGAGGNRVVPYVSAFTAGKIVQAAGKPAESRKALEAALKEQKIETRAALQAIPEGDEGDIEAVSRLISLARGNGYCVELTDSTGGQVSFKISMPKTLGMLQSGHHITSKV